MTNITQFDEDVEPPAVVGVLGLGDTGVLPIETRRALVQLLHGPYVGRVKTPQLWMQLIGHELTIRSRLADLFLELVIDREAGLAFVRNIDSEDAQQVLRRTKLTLIDTALVLHLRAQLLSAEIATGRAFIGRDEIDETLAVYRNSTRADASGFTRRVNRSVEKMKDSSILLSTDEEGRFEISPVLRLVFGAEEVREVTRQLAALLNQGEIAITDDSEVVE
ncbi:MAG: DUF4194 domain-containing protein [Propionibacteriaceae bacterium]|jgi:hypothetical protein|nr:DUF4194 domain-containing protein [Propionibacteriaceae bacterium]